MSTNMSLVYELISAFSFIHLVMANHFRSMYELTPSFLPPYGDIYGVLDWYSGGRATVWLFFVVWVVGRRKGRLKVHRPMNPLSSSTALLLVGLVLLRNLVWRSSCPPHPFSCLQSPPPGTAQLPHLRMASLIHGQAECLLVAFLTRFQSA